MSEAIRLYDIKEETKADLFELAERLRDELVYECDNFEAFSDNAQWDDEQRAQSVRTHLNNVKYIADKLLKEME